MFLVSQWPVLVLNEFLTLVETLANITKGTYIKKIILVKQADNEQPVDKTLLSEVELLIEMKTDDQKKSLLR
jgi:hypothetical protein